MKRINVLFAAAAVLCLIVLSGFAPLLPERVAPRFFLGDIVNLDTVTIRLSDCSAQGEVCLPLTLGQALQLNITDNGTPVDVSIMNGCDFDTTSAYTYSTLFGQGNFGPYYLTSWPVGGQIYADTFNTIPELVDSMNIWDPLGNWMHDEDHMLITGGFPGNMYDTMKVWVIQIQTPSFIGYNFGVTPRGTSMMFDKGFHTVVLEDPNANMRDTFFVHVSCAEQVDRVVDVDSTDVFCLDFGDLLTAPESITLCNPTGLAVDFQLVNGDSCVSYTGLSFGLSETCVVACDSTGFCDTTFLRVRVKGAGTTYNHYIEIAEGENGILCLDTLSLTGPVMAVMVCSMDNDGFVGFNLTPDTRCIEFAGLLEGGTDTICVAACDANFICDTTFLAVKVRRFGPEWVYDTLYLNKLGRFCVDQYNVPGAPAQLEVFKMPNPLIMFHNLNQTDFCATYIGLRAATDTLGVRLRDDGGVYDSTYIVLTTLKPDTEVIYDTLGAGETHIFCLDTTQLGGSGFLWDNLCKNSSDDDVAFSVNDVTLCLQLQAITPGTDTACIIVCDNLGVCDTVIFYVTALDDNSNPQQPPVAFSDSISTEGSQPVAVPVLDNDSIGLSFTDILVLPASGNFGPLHGTATVDTGTGIVTFDPDEGFCNDTDNFRYIVCNAWGCDTALVTIAIQCDSATVDPARRTTVHDAFSPNGDNYNETFTIENVEYFPDSEVRIYNRWGNEVYFAKSYKNTWTGTWNDKPLPDGIYFYYFNNGFDRIQKGVLLIHR